MALATTGEFHNNPMCVHRVRVERGLEPRRPRTAVPDFLSVAAADARDYDTVGAHLREVPR